MGERDHSFRLSRRGETRVLQLTSVICIEWQAIIICKVIQTIFECCHCENRCLPPAQFQLSSSFLIEITSIFSWVFQVQMRIS